MYMITGVGKSVCEGIEVGKIFFYEKLVKEIKKCFIEDVEVELLQFNKAKEIAREQLRLLYDKALQDVGENEAMIIEVQQLLLEDSDFNDSITEKVREDKLNVEYAVYKAGEEFANIFSSMEDEYMRLRAEDMRDITNRILTVLNGGQRDLYMEEPMIVVAENLVPSETIQFEKNKILAFVTKQGSYNSHTAILARTMNIPSIVQADISFNDNLQGKVMIVDGINGSYYIEPDKNTLAVMMAKKKQYIKEREQLNELKGLEDITVDGKKVRLYSNIGSIDDVSKVLENDSQGIGLFRSEFLYLGRTNYPTEEEQFKAYKAVASAMGEKKVIIRTLDIGADKQVDYFKMDKEENPAMGFRAIRICLERPEIFKTQLRAIYRASVYGNISLMFPMIISIDEVKKIKEIIKEVKLELSAEGMAFENMDLGIMIETPAAVMISDELAMEVDFFSVGTNDLIQYTLAIDRQNQKLDRFYNPYHDAIIKMLDIVVKNAHNNGIWAGICGELASDLSMTERFLKMGFDELSVAPGKTLQMRKKIREIKTQ